MGLNINWEAISPQQLSPDMAINVTIKLSLQMDHLHLSLQNQIPLAVSPMKFYFFLVIIV